MKKFVYLIVVLALAWLMKLSYDVYAMTQQLDTIQNDLHQSEQKNAMLTDQLVALQRSVDINSATSSSTTPTGQPPLLQTGLSPIILIKQRLELVQFALQQQQFVYAIEKLNELDYAIEHYALAETLKRSLHQTIAQDKTSIQQFTMAKNQQLEKFDAALLQIDQQLLLQADNTQLKPTQKTTAHFWQNWFSIQTVKQPEVELVNRRMILKEVQIRILSAQQSLSRGQMKDYQQMLDFSIQQLDTLPDADSQKLKQNMIQLKLLPIIPTPKLNSLAVMG